MPERSTAPMLDERASLKRWARWLARSVPFTVLGTFLIAWGRGELGLLFLGLSVSSALGAAAGVLGWFAWPDSPPSLRNMIVTILALGVGAFFLAAFMWIYAFEHDFTF